MEQNEFNNSLDRLLDVTRYKGCLIYISSHGFTALNVWFPDIQGAKDHIDNSFKILQNSLRYEQE